MDVWWFGASNFFIQAGIEALLYPVDEASAETFLWGGGAIPRVVIDKGNELRVQYGE